MKQTNPPVLEFAQGNHVLEPFPRCLDMSVKHGGVRLYPDFVGLPHYVEPAFPIQFLRAELFPNAFAENFRASAGKHPQSGRFQPGEDFSDRNALHLRKMGNLHRGESLDERIRLQCLYFAQQFLEIGEGEVGMAAAHHVDLRQPVSLRTDPVEDFLLGEFEGEGVPFLPAESAEPASVHADVRIVDLSIDDIIGRITVEPGSDEMGQ